MAGSWRARKHFIFCFFNSQPTTACCNGGCRSDLPNVLLNTSIVFASDSTVSLFLLSELSRGCEHPANRTQQPQKLVACQSILCWNARNRYWHRSSHTLRGLLLTHLSFQVNTVWSTCRSPWSRYSRTLQPLASQLETILYSRGTWQCKLSIVCCWW